MLLCVLDQKRIDYSLAWGEGGFEAWSLWREAQLRVISPICLKLALNVYIYSCPKICPYPALSLSLSIYIYIYIYLYLGSISSLMQISSNKIDILCQHIFFWIRSNSRITFYRIRWEVIYVLSIVVCIPSTFCPTLGQSSGEDQFQE